MVEIKTALEKYTLCFYRVNSEEVRYKYWLKSKPAPQAFVKIDVDAEALPCALRDAWAKLAEQDLSYIREIHFQGAMLKTNTCDQYRNLLNMCYNAYMGLLPAQARLCSWNLAYRHCFYPITDNRRYDWLLQNYDRFLVDRYAKGHPEALIELLGTDFSLQMIKEGYLTSYVIPGYINALESIRKEMRFYEGQIEMARNVYKDMYYSDMPTLSDVFIREYFNEIAAEANCLYTKQAIVSLLEMDDCIDYFKSAIDSGFLLEKYNIDEYIPVTVWDLKEQPILYDYTGQCLARAKP